MSCSGHLPPPHLAPHTVRCGDREFPSASAALDAYIADFEQWRQAPGRLACSTGPQLDLLPPGTPTPQPGTPTPQPGPTRPPGTLCNRDVLSELLTDKELCFLSLPATTSLCCRANGDEGALTTEELLAIPSDGSLPVTKTTAYLTDLRHRSLCCCSNSRLLQPGLCCHSCGSLGRTRDRSHTPSPTTLKWRGKDMDQSLSLLQTVGPVIGADHRQSSSNFSDSSWFLATHPTGRAHSLKSSHLQSPSQMWRSHKSLNMVDHAQFGHGHQRQQLDGQLAAAPAGFWESPGSITPRAPSWLDQLPVEEEEEEEEEELELLSVSLLAEDTPVSLLAEDTPAGGDHHLQLAHTEHAPIGHTHPGHMTL